LASANAWALETGPALYGLRLPAAAMPLIQSSAAAGSAADNRIRTRRTPRACVK
jgi:hypothetical protein